MSDSDSTKFFKFLSHDQSFVLEDKPGSNSVGYKAIGKIKQVLKAAAEKIAQVFTAREPSREALNAYRQRVVTNNQPNMFRKLPDNIIKPDSAVPPEVKRIEELKGVKDRGRRQSRSVSHVDLSR